MSKNPEDYPSDSDESDEDFKPDKEEVQSGSEIDSDDNLEEEDDDDKTSSRKRKRKDDKSNNKKARSADSKTKPNSPKKLDELDDDDEEQLTDALWADFLAGTDSSSSSKVTAKKEPSKATSTVVTKKPSETSVSQTAVSNKLSESAETRTVTKIFEFAGEKVEVTEKISCAESVKSKPSPLSVSSGANGAGGLPKPAIGGSARPTLGSGGLGSVLNQIGKKNKLTTLEKTKLDWKQFKSHEGIEEELETHNKGKDGYLERQDFLQRTDVRQFEIEKSFRLTKRSNR
ncbi:craniofacial development protein 1 [Uranotaenia lowii]|uniref:craniofacial development protein 1 n=1 Tax=Uranotaenia lowii TaxID=190385 RepID=UPI002479EF3C|nr:craniofacial development protein 1 [Uranotaenia lowii]